MAKYDHTKIEEKWREIWDKTKIDNTDFLSDRKKYYNLMMFPYPSGEYLHMGHGYSYSGADVNARYQRARGFNVFEPIGYDSFGLPAENYAIKKGVNPADSTAENIKHAQIQLKSFGCMFDWEKTVVTSDPSYYKWTQWLFLQLYKQGLAYQKEAPVNWCPKCLTVLANEQVINGLCERCETEVVQKMLTQWFFKTTEYAERLIDDLDKVDWPESSKIKQKNWIGKSVGTEFEMTIDGQEDRIEVFTTRIDTVFGMSYVVLAPEHPLVKKIVKQDQEKEASDYQIKTQKMSDLERQSLEKEKTGVFTGSFAINPFNGEKVPIWIADYVIYTYGTGAVMAVPAHDERDFEFAKKYQLPVIPVIGPENSIEVKLPFTEHGILINSAEFSGLSSEKAKDKMSNWLADKKIGTKKINYRLRDWSFSRQRYWGAPIPVIYCDKCGTVPVPEKDLPVTLPKIKDFRPSGTGNGPLATVPEFVNTVCPVCNEPAKRETDTMDTFVCSSFYFLRYPNVGDDAKMMDPEVTQKWLPVDMYTGGAEHVTMHLLYSRFVTKALFDAGLITFDEPFLKLRHQGMILGPDGKKMSKSKGNVVIPNKVIEENGADSFRTYILFMGPFEDGGPWNPAGIKGVNRFLSRYFDLVQEAVTLNKEENPIDTAYSSKEIEEAAVIRTLHKTIKKIGADIEEFKFNTAVSSLMECINELYELRKKLPVQKSPVIWRESITKLTQILAPFAPFITEEAWAQFGFESSVHLSPWPEYDEGLIEEDLVTIVVQINGKVRANIEMSKKSTQEDVEKAAFEDSNVKKNLEGKKPKKVIYVPGKILNVVI